MFLQVRPGASFLSPRAGFDGPNALTSGGLANTDSTRLHNRETAGQFLTVPLHKVDDLFGDLQSNRRRISEKNHTLRVFPKGKHKLAEIFIFRNYDSLLLRGKMEDLGVFRPGGYF